MTPRQQVSRAALELIRSFEGFRETAAQLPDGRWTVGHGHTKTARQGACVSLDDARALLIYDLLEVTAAINASVFTPLTQNQFDALSAFVFNVGVAGFRGSAVLHRLNEGQLLQAAYAMELWRKAEFDGEAIVVDALVRRRAAEKALFLTPADGFVPSPSPLLRPRLDNDGLDQTPIQPPVEIVPSLRGEQISAQRIEPPLIARPIEDDAPALAEIAAERPPEVIAAAAPQPEPQPEPEPDQVLEAPEPLAHAAAPEPVAYDGVPVSAPTVEEESPLPPSAESIETLTQASAHDTVVADALVMAPEVKTFDATSPAQPARRRTLALTAILGAIGAGLFGVGVVAVYRGKYENSGSTGVAVVIGIAGLLCLAAVAYILLDQMGARDE